MYSGKNNKKGILKPLNNNKKLTLKDKRAIAKYKNENSMVRMTDIARDYNVSYDTVRQIIKNQNFLLSIDENNSILNNKNVVLAPEQKTFELECHLLDEFDKLREKGISVDKLMIKSIAKDYVDNHDTFNFNITSYFIRKFIERHNLKFRNLHGESQATTTDNYESFFYEYEEICKNYFPQDIYNIDETGIFYKEQGRRSYTKSNKDSKGYKLQKTRITLLLGVNKLGDFLPPMIIGKSKQPRCFKKASPQSFNIIYSHNKSAWLTKIDFANYCNEINNTLVKENRKILILIDNFSGHNIEAPSNIRFLRFPPNSTSKLQPLDLSPNNTIKQYYKSLLRQHIYCASINNGLELPGILRNVTLTEVFSWITMSISHCTKISVINAWKKFESMNPKKLQGNIDNMMEKNEAEISEDEDEYLCKSVLIDDCFTEINSEPPSNFELNYLLTKLENMNESKSPETRLAFFKYKASLKNDIYVKSKKD